MKIGFELLSDALDGLGRITHLINVDTVEDLISYMKTILEHQPPVEHAVQLQCVHCVLRTLSGPGQEMNIDDEYFVNKLHAIMDELPLMFSRWDVVLDCIDLYLLQKREERTAKVSAMVRALLLLLIHMPGHGTLSSVNAFVSVINSILLRYPRARAAVDVLRLQYATAPDASSSAAAAASGFSGSSYRATEEDEVADFAMAALRGSGCSSSKGNNKATNLLSDSGSGDVGDGSWVLPLLAAHIDGSVRQLIAPLVSRVLITTPVVTANAQIRDASTMLIHSVSASIDSLLRRQSRTAPVSSVAGNFGKNKQFSQNSHESVQNAGIAYSANHRGGDGARSPGGHSGKRRSYSQNDGDHNNSSYGSKMLDKHASSSHTKKRPKLASSRKHASSAGATAISKRKYHPKKNPYSSTYGL
jgi:hypothetical protein